MSNLVNNQMVSETKPELSGLKDNKIIFGVFEGKSQSDYESAWSPTSPLDFRLFSSLGNPFGGSFSRSIRKMHQKSWDSGKVGLSIVDSLDDHHTRILLPSPDSKNIIFGSWMKIGNSKCQKPQLLPNPIVEDSMHKDNQPNVDLIKLDTTSSVSSAGNIINAGQMMEQTQESLNKHTESDIEVSEDYTCVISHGPNPKTTHFYGDRVMDSIERNGLKKDCCGNKKESIFVIAPLELTTSTDVLPYNDFLSFCCFCSKELGMEKDIYMYRGCKACCSIECRSEMIQLDEEIEEAEDEVDKSSSSSDKDL